MPIFDLAQTALPTLKLTPSPSNPTTASSLPLMKTATSASSRSTAVCLVPPSPSRHPAELSLLLSGQHLVSTIAHLDGVTSLSFTDPGSGSSRYRSATLASTSRDVSLRIWNVSYNYEEYPLTEIEFTCVQEASTHRVKGAKGVLGLAVREGGRVAVTAGADGTVRVWER